MTASIQPLVPADLEAARHLLAASCAFDPAAEVAGEKLFGPSPHGRPHTLGAHAGGRMAGVAVVSGAWLRLLAVHPRDRGRGLGSALLDAAEAVIARSGARAIRVLDQPGNYLAPGIDIRNHETIAWLERRGYARGHERENLLVDLRHNPRVSADRARALAAACTGYHIRRAGRADRDALRAMVEAAFSPAWAFEVDRAMDLTPPGAHIAVHRDSGALVAFAAHDGNNRGLGWFGPGGTLAAHRGQGLGAALLLACLADVAAAGREVCEIAWIGPRGFYERAAGVSGERRFIAMTKEIAS